LLVPSHRHLTSVHAPSYPSSAELQWVHDRAVANLPASDSKYGERIYVSRQDVTKRQVQNHDAVVSTLEQFGFEVYEPGTLPYREQVRLFSGADIIVGPHGAGLANLVFADTGTTAVEVLTDAKPNLHYFVLANLRNLDYEYIECQPLSGTYERDRHADIAVDVTEVETVVTSLLGEAHPQV